MIMCVRMYHKEGALGNCYCWLDLDNEALVLKASNCHLFLSFFLSFFAIKILC